MSDAPVAEQVSKRVLADLAAPRNGAARGLVGRLRCVGGQMLSARKLELGILLGIVTLCLAYCLMTSRQYESKAVLALRVAPVSTLRANGSEPASSGSFASGQVQLETLAGELRSDRLAWRVILDEKLYQAPAFNGRFAVRYAGFRPDAPSPAAEAYLLERFADRLRVRTIPRTLLLEVRFRSAEAALSSATVEALLRAYTGESASGRVTATQKASGLLQQQLVEMRARADAADEHAVAFQREHGLLETPGTQSDGQPSSTQHNQAVLQADELNRELVSAEAERMIREAEFREAEHGDPELVLEADTHLQGDAGSTSSALFRQIHTRRNELAVERAQLSAEHGPNYPRVVEIAKEMDELDRQLVRLNAQLLERFRTAWQTASDRERMLREERDAETGKGLTADAAAARLAVMRREAEEIRAVYLRLRDKADEADAVAGLDAPGFEVVDVPRQASRPVWPNWTLSLAIALFVGIWLAAGTRFVVDRMLRAAALAVGIIIFTGTAALRAQAPTPSTSGLPTGVARLPQTGDSRATPNPADAREGWSGAGSVARPIPAAAASANALPGPLGPGDTIEVSEAHMPEFHAVARVSAAGVVVLPLVGEVKLADMDESRAANAIASMLAKRGMLLHPQVFVTIMASGTQDVTVLGEVLRPGEYAYGVHHRLLDVISQASGLTPGAGTLVYISHRQDARAAVAVALDPTGAGRPEDHNPELLPGDTVQVTRVGLVYVVGDVIRPGGFPLEPSRQTTVLHALSLAWGPSQNAALSKALLIREQNGGRTVTTLNLKRMLRGKDPDLPLSERDIIFVPDSTAKNLLNRTAESLVQSAVGVSIYSAEVYSQRF